MKNHVRQSILLGVFFLLGLFTNSANATETLNTQKLSFQTLKMNQYSWNSNLNLSRNYNLRLSSLDFSLSPYKKEGKTYKRKSPLLAAALNFVLPGAGYLYNGQQHPLLSVGMMAGAVGLTYVEFNIKESSPDMYPIMFGSVLVLNTSISIDTFIKTKKKNELHNL
ncbi:MAG: hypothetical protein ACI8ZM_001105 [Crocinitomix sp.]|jgi:hypothetical protein